MLVLALLVGLAVVAVVRGRSAAQASFDAALIAHEAGDCRAAIEGYEEAGRSWWTFSPVRGQAERNTEQCESYLEGEDAAADQDYLLAVTEYDDYLNEHRGSLLEQRASDARDTAFADLAASVLDRGDALVAQGEPDASRYREAVVQYLDVLRLYPDTDAAGRVPQSLTAAYDRAAGLLGAQRWCEAVEVLEVFADSAEPALGETAGRARAALPLPLYECGLVRFAQGDAETAVGLLRRLSDTYPGDPLTAQARPTLIRAEVAAITDLAAGELPPPVAVGQARAGTVSVEVVNDSPEELEVLFAGPQADTITIPPCATCSAYFLQGLGACAAASLPTVSLELQPGTYQLGVRSRSGNDVVPYAGTWDLTPGTAYSSCFFIVESFG